MGWQPTTDFENEIVSLQPEHHFIFTNTVEDSTIEVNYPRPADHLEYAAIKKKIYQENAGAIPKQKMHVIAKIQGIAESKPLGELPAIDDWDDKANLERDTILMMRKLGLGPYVDEPLDPNKTTPTYPIPDNIRIVKSGSTTFPIIFDDNFFKLVPTENDEIIQSTSLPDELPKTNPHRFKEKRSVRDGLDDCMLDEVTFSSGSSNSNSKSRSPNSYQKLFTENDFPSLKNKSPRNQFCTPRELYIKKRSTNGACNAHKSYKKFN